MSYIRIPKKSAGRLPSLPSIGEDDANVNPIEPTLWKCRRQLMGTLIICLGVFGVGTVFGWAAVALPDLKESKEIDYDNPEIEASVASIFIIGAMFAGPAAGYCMYTLGRKLTTFWFSLLFSIGWIIIPVAHLIEDNVKACEGVLLFGRFITGFAGAGCLVVGPVYVQEMCDESIRTAMGSLVPLVLVLGNTFCFSCGPFMKWWVLSICCIIPPGALTVLIWFIPNTPRHLLLVRKVEEARKSMQWLTFGFTPEERERIFRRVKHGVEMLNENSNRAMKKSERKQRDRRLHLKLKSRPVLHPLIISILLIFFQQGSGNNVMSTYIQEILLLGERTVSMKTGTLIIGIVYFLVVIAAVLVVERLGRKPLLLSGILIQFLMQITLGVFFYYTTDINHNAYMLENFSWIPIICSNVFFVGYAMGLGTVTWIMATEINHPDFQEIAGSLDSFTYWLTAFTSIMTLPSLRVAIKLYWCFWFYSFMNFIAFWFAFFFIYETKGKTQEDIMAHYRGHSYNPGEGDDDADSRSIGSIHNKHSQGSGIHHHHSRASGDSGGSEWSITDFQTIYETENKDMTK